ncbi:caprin-1-like isoform X2 [Mytilus californianus]|uniref:caprin-1-like isoform X2 n=1 Tax=Mytilus californianus TaxID=6549 RepID=UPI00224825E7|nr:caprin-1-like isoform X2 [Mytilus californianus]
MPAASTKAEKQVNSDAGDPMKQILAVLEKKVRNLEKRKGKLDAYREKQDKGIPLEKDQQVAVDKYNEVEQNLIFAQELMKQFLSINADAEKYNKKHAKKEKLERQTAELKRVKEMLRVQNLLDGLGSDQVRSDFQKGRHGAVVLSEENLNQLDDLYKLINPSREADVDHLAQLTTAADHVVNLIDAKEKEVVGTTYKVLKALIDDISGCGYFEQALKEETAEECNTEQEFVVVNSQEVPEPDSVEVQSALPPDVSEEQPEMTTENGQPTMNNLQDPDSFFSEAPTATTTQQDVSYQRQRPFQEIVSSVQGNFNFLQESTIDMECVSLQLSAMDCSPHMDPAVVAAHPMPGRPQSRQTDSGMSQTFTNSGYGGDVHQQQQTPSLSQTTETPQSYSQPGHSSQSYGQNSADSLFSQDTISQKVLGQSVPDSTISQFELHSQPLPMPPGRDSNQQNSQSSESQADKKFTMNPNAGVFQSQLYSSSHTDGEDSPQNEQSEGGNFQSGNSYRGNQWKGRGGRGGDRGGMSNGYGNRNNRGSEGNYRGGNRGGYQGYPPRDNYRPDGYQGYNGNYSGGGGFKRGQSRGGPRGGRGAPRGGRGSGSGHRGSSSGGFGKPQAQQVS